MRLSNFFIYGSLAIIVSLTVGYMVFKLFDRSGDSNNPSREQLAKQLAELEKVNEQLLEDSASTVESLSNKITSLHDDLHRSSKLVMEKDNEIAQLKSQFDSSTVHTELAKVLNCNPADVQNAVTGLAKSFHDLQIKYQLVNQQLATANSALAKVNQLRTAEENNQNNTVAANSDVNLNKPQNQSADGNQKGNEQNRVVQDLTNQTQQGGLSVQTLQARVEALQIELKNREKLLYEQTSLIEDLKKKSSRIETGFRTGKNASQSVPVNTPFRDRGTFRVKN